VYNLTHHFPDKRQVRIGQNFLKHLIIYQRVSLKIHKQTNLTLRKSYLVAILGINLTYYIHKCFQQQWDNDDADTVHNKTDKRLSIALTANKLNAYGCLKFKIDHKINSAISVGDIIISILYTI